MTLRWKCLHKWILKSPKVTLKREDTWVRKRFVKIPNNNTSNPSGNNATWNSTRPKYRQFPCIIRVCKRARYKTLLEQQKVTAKRSMSWAVYYKMSWQSLPIRTPNHFRTPESSHIDNILYFPYLAPQAKIFGYFPREKTVGLFFLNLIFDFFLNFIFDFFELYEKV